MIFLSWQEMFLHQSPISFAQLAARRYNRVMKIPAKSGAAEQYGQPAMPVAGKATGTAPPSAPLDYIPRIRSYYLALGYPEPYRWAEQSEIPLKQLDKPLAEATIGLITTAAPFRAGLGDQGPGAAYNGKAKFFEVYTDTTRQADGSLARPDLRVSHIAIDRDHSRADDQNSYFPLQALETLRQQGIIGAIARRFYGLPTHRSHRITCDEYAPRLVRLLQEDGCDAAVLVPNCPVCHQSCALVASALEAAGIATVIMGCARDIIARVGAPRMLFCDLPLGNSAGIPHDTQGQLLAARLAVGMLQTATSSRQIETAPLVWPEAADWKQDYANADRLSADELARRRADFDAAKADSRPLSAAAGNAGNTTA